MELARIFAQAQTTGRPEVDESLNLFKESVYTCLREIAEAVANCKDIRGIDKEIKQTEFKYEAIKRRYTEQVRKLFVRTRIAAINEKSDPTDEELRQLVVGGCDEYSNLRFNDLQKQMIAMYGLEDTDRMIDALIKEFQNSIKYICTTLRWILRGLYFDYAVIKVMLDAREIDGVEFYVQE